MLVRKNRLQLPVSFSQWMKTVTRESQLEVLGISTEVIVQVHTLPEIFHGDPADQIIVATALANNCPLVTIDTKILEHRLTKSVY